MSDPLRVEEVDEVVRSVVGSLDPAVLVVEVSSEVRAGGPTVHRYDLEEVAPGRRRAVVVVSADPSAPRNARLVTLGARHRVLVANSRTQITEALGRELAPGARSPWWSTPTQGDPLSDRRLLALGRAATLSACAPGEDPRSALLRLGVGASLAEAVLDLLWYGYEGASARAAGTSARPTARTVLLDLDSGVPLEWALRRVTP